MLAILIYVSPTSSPICQRIWSSQAATLLVLMLPAVYHVLGSHVIHKFRVLDIIICTIRVK